MTIYSLKAIDGGEIRLFSTLDAMARWLNCQAPGCFYQVLADGTHETYDRTTAALLAKLLDDMPCGLLPSLHAEVGWFGLEVEQQWTWARVNVID